MKALIVEDEFASRFLLSKILSKYAHCDLAVNGFEALTYFNESITSSEYYDLICLDIMMHEMDGHQVLKEIRKIEDKNGVLATGGVKVIMTTALSDAKNIISAFKERCEGYIVKPIDKEKLLDAIKVMGLIE